MPDEAFFDAEGVAEDFELEGAMVVWAKEVLEGFFEMDCTVVGNGKLDLGGGVAEEDLEDPILIDFFDVEAVAEDFESEGTGVDLDACGSVGDLAACEDEMGRGKLVFKRAEEGLAWLDSAVVKTGAVGVSGIPTLDAVDSMDAEPGPRLTEESTDPAPGIKEPAELGVEMAVAKVGTDASAVLGTVASLVGILGPFIVETNVPASGIFAELISVAKFGLAGVAMTVA